MFYRQKGAADTRPLKIAVIGSGISGLSAAWLLSMRHQVTVFEGDQRIGGHSHTVLAGAAKIPVDTGFIVYNEATYPNLTALFKHLDVATKPSDMSFAVSLDGGRLEYAGTDLNGLFAQRQNILSPRFWSMIRDLLRFYRDAPRDVADLGLISLGDYLDREGYGPAFREDHLYPMAAAIWSTPAADIAAYPAAAFIRFCDNHGLLKIRDRPIWRTVEGGSRSYVQRLSEAFSDRIRTGAAVRSIRRVPGAVDIGDESGHVERFDHVVVATHADQALRLLTDPDRAEGRLLGSFGYSRNTAVLHADTALMPGRRAVWSSWNYLSRGTGDAKKLSVTYWMNRLQGIPETHPLFVTLNPTIAPRDNLVIRSQVYEHPIFDARAIAAQSELWSLQGNRNTWYCGSYFGSGFHEDGLQAGLAVAEAMVGVRRPWTVAGESDRIVVTPLRQAPPLEAVS